VMMLILSKGLGDTFQGGLYTNPKTKVQTLGDKLSIKWSVVGNPSLCKYKQDETGIKAASLFRDANGKWQYTITQGNVFDIPFGDDGIYDDAMGFPLTFDDVGFYGYIVSGKIVLKCTGTDGVTKEKEIAIQSAVWYERTKKGGKLIKEIPPQISRNSY